MAVARHCCRVVAAVELRRDYGLSPGVLLSSLKPHTFHLCGTLWHTNRQAATEPCKNIGSINMKHVSLTLTRMCMIAMKLMRKTGRSCARVQAQSHTAS